MINPSPHSIGHRVALLLVRVSLGVYLFSAGMHKAFMPGKSIGESAQAWMTGYRAKVPSFLPNFIATPYGYAIPWLEMTLGLLLIAGLFFRVTTVATTLLLLSIAVAVVAEAGSFSGGGATAVHHSIVLATVCMLLFFTGAGGFSVDAMLPKRRRR